ncbi:MAG: selenide, water dikinase SelD [Phycisphaerae bacterium]
MPQTGMAQVLRQLAPQQHPDLLVGTETFDDAGVFRISDELALVQTVDFFPPLVDDPYQFGRIAAANALSDIYAMGGEPLTALNLVGFPDKELDYDVLVEILRGGADAVREAGAVIVGGHSVRDAEVKYGLAVTGRVHPKRIWTNAGARAGDRLVLTKPLGSGVLSSAAKSGKMAAEELGEVIRVMAGLNKFARDAAREFEIHACTDISGFGLIGHAAEMAEGSGVSIAIRASAVPLMARTLEFARAGILTRAAKNSREYLGAKLQVDAGVEPALAGVLMDAQTSGGLLFSIAPDCCDQLAARLRRSGAECAAEVGEVRSAADWRIRVAS